MTDTWGRMNNLDDLNALHKQLLPHDDQAGVPFDHAWSLSVGHVPMQCDSEDCTAAAVVVARIGNGVTCYCEYCWRGTGSCGSWTTLHDCTHATRRNDKSRTRAPLPRTPARLFPVPLPDVTSGSTGKIPAIPWKEYQSRLPTLDELQQWFADEQNIAIVCGVISNIVVVDVDALDARAWWIAHRPFTPWCVHTSKGAHFYYAHPGATCRTRRVSRRQTGNSPLMCAAMVGM